MDNDQRDKPVGIIGTGARPKHPKGPNALNVRGAPAGNQQEQPQAAQNPWQFPGIFDILIDWTLIQGLLGPIIEQKDAICWAIVLARLLEAIHNITVRNPSLFVRISINDLVKKIKKDETNMEITSLKRSIKLIGSDGIARTPDTSNANPKLAKEITWPFDSNEAADRSFIEARLELSPVGIIIDIDGEFEALREGFYKIRVVPPNRHGKVERHALMIMGLGRTKDGQRFFIVQNSWKKTWGVNGYGRLVMDDDTKCVAFYPLLP